MAYFLVGKDNSSLFSKRTTWDFDAAIAAASDGDTIEIQENFKVEFGSILIDKNLSFIGNVIEEEQLILPTLDGLFAIDGVNVTFKNLALNVKEEKYNCLNIKPGSSVLLDTVLLESNQTEGEIYPICYSKDSTVTIKNSVVRSFQPDKRQRIYFDNSTVLIQDTNIYVQTVFDNSRFELSNIELEVSDNNGIFLGTKSEGSIKSSILFAGSFENKRSTIECTQSSLTLLDTRVFLDNDEKYINACYLKESSLSVGFAMLHSIKTVKSSVYIEDHLGLVELGDFEDHSSVTGNILMVLGGNHNKINVYSDGNSNLRLNKIIVGMKTNPDIKLERNVKFEVGELLRVKTNEDYTDVILDENNQYTLVNDEVSISHFGEKTTFEKLQDMIGLDSVKNEVQEFIAITNMNKSRKDKGFNTSGVTLHSLFLGNPGTGKTTVARLMGKLLYENNIIPTDKYVETSRSDLVGQHIGHTAIKTRKVLESALGGVLFIDEAYTLAKGGEKDFGSEAIDEILKFMEDHREDIVLIFAGYTKDMEKFLEMNEGLRSRIPNVFHFEDYSIEQLYQIGLNDLVSKGYKVDVEAYQKLLKNNFERSNDFSNGRWVRNQNEKILRKVAMYLFENNIEIIETIPSEVLENCYI
ncbi:AAA family ATPase [Streptococcus mitis]|uniref:ATPase, AAA family protein n=1 Tax=Streptococcus mitis TaxID=28037 RepID=A0A139QCS9_STRMT|nr:AAA family ATPase [Streptococcus mitis]KXU00347.1 ATPase, AAA family protein [Streptococcus mitis]